MAGYYIYLPGAKGCDPEHLDRVGLGMLRADVSPSYAEVLEHGPDNGGGLLAWWDDPSKGLPPPSVRMASQVWQPAEAYNDLPAGRYWLGYEKASRPGPGDLQRPCQHLGRDVVLGDGQAWHVPIALQLPHVLGLGGRKKVRSSYKAFFDAAMDAVTWVSVSPEGIPIWKYIDGQAFALAAWALEQNYRLTADIVELLELVDTQNALLVVAVTCESDELFKRMVDVQKKTTSPAPGTPNSADGVPA